jgi:hypothetical protein
MSTVVLAILLLVMLAGMIWQSNNLLLIQQIGVQPAGSALLLQILYYGYGRCLCLWMVRNRRLLLASAVHQ